MVHRHHVGLLLRLADHIGPVARLGDRQESPGELVQRLTQVAVGQKVDAPGDLEGRHGDQRLLRDLGGAQLGQGFDVEVRHPEDHRGEVHLREFGASRLAVRAELVDHDVRQDDEVVIGLIEDVRQSPLPCRQSAADHEGVGVQRDRDHLFRHGLEHAP